MDMSQFVLNNGPETRRSNAGSNVYDLAAVIVHHGNGYVRADRKIPVKFLTFLFFLYICSSSCGHYTSFAINNGTWLHFNDHTVKEVAVKAVAECKPYILFYNRREMNKTL